MELPKEVKEIAEAVGGEIKDIIRLPDGSGAATLSMSLPRTHWIYKQPGDDFCAPPMPLRIGSSQHVVIAFGKSHGGLSLEMSDRLRELPLCLDRQQMAEAIRAAGRYAVKAATMNGTETDFDPDALVQNLVIGMLGYFTDDGLNHEDARANPPVPYDFSHRDPPPGNDGRVGCAPNLKGV